MDTIRYMTSTLLRDLIHGDWMMKILSLFMVCCLIAVTLMIGGLIWYAGYLFHDKIFYRHFIINHSGRINVLNKQYQASYSTTTMISMSGPNNTTTMIPQTTYHPARYLVTLSAPEIGQIEIDDESLYNEVTTGDNPNMAYEAEFRVRKTGGKEEFLRYQNFRIQ